MLLEHTIGDLNPLYIANIVPDGLEIPCFVSLSQIFRDFFNLKLWNKLNIYFQTSLKLSDILFRTNLAFDNISKF